MYSILILYFSKNFPFKLFQNGITESLIVRNQVKQSPDFTISVYSSSCNSYFFCLILVHLLSLSSQPALGMQLKKKKTGGRKKKYLNELLYTEMVKSGTIRLAYIRLCGSSRNYIFWILYSLFFFFLRLFHGIPSCIRNAKKQKEKAKE